MTTTRNVVWIPDLAIKLNRDRTTLWRWRRLELLPKPDVTIAGRVGWYDETLDNFFAKGAKTP